jgi:hypothetical protein
MAYQVTFTLNSAYTGTTEADNFTIIGKHCNGTPSDTIIATNVTKAQLTAGVIYQVADTVSGGTVTSTGTCTNSVPWTGLNNCGPGDGLGEPDGPGATPAPTSTPALYTYYVSQFRLGDLQSVAEEFCTLGYLTNTVVRSTATTVSSLLNQTLYDESGNEFVVGAGRWAYVATDEGLNSRDAANNPRYLIQMNGSTVENLALLDCTGGGGGEV